MRDDQLEKEAMLVQRILESLKQVGTSNTFIAELSLSVPEQLDLVKVKRDMGVHA